MAIGMFLQSSIQVRLKPRLPPGLGLTIARE